MKHSIRRQFALIFIGLMTGIILVCLLWDHLFLEDYYIRSKIKVIKDAYYTIGRAANSDTYSTETFREELDSICSVNNITVCVMDANSQTRYSSRNGGRELENLLVGYVFGFYQNSVSVMEEGKDYILQKVLGETEYLEMYGSLNSGISFIMRTPLESIRESAKVANRFFAYVGILGALAGGVVIWLVASRITKPIMKLNGISEQMVHLNFDAKYSGGQKNEIGMLGENINKLSESLERAISDLKTANNELQRDIERKEEIDVMRREFLANVSHELKTPIALIQGYAEGLAESVNEDPESRSYYCDVIMDEAARMNKMVRQLLTLNQLESGKSAVTMERFELTSLIRSYLQSASILAQQKGIRVRFEEKEPVYVWGDEFKVEEVLMNYFTNAVNYCKGEGMIEVTLEVSEELVRTGVYNTGERIPQEAMPLLWDKFYKVDKARTREYGGSGVGLSIVKAIMESLNRGYGVENREDGVLFWFELERFRELPA